MSTPVLNASPASVVLMPVTEPRQQRATHRKRMKPFRALGLVLLLVAGLFVGGLSASGVPSAQASPFDFFCNYTDPPEKMEQNNPGDVVFEAWPGVAGQLAQTANNIYPITSGMGAVTGLLNGDDTLDSSVAYPPNVPVTAYEWWGTAGLSWKQANYEDVGGACGVEGLFSRSSVNVISNLIWGFVATVGSFGLILYYYAASPDALSPFLTEGGPIDSLLSNSLDGIFLIFLAPIIILTALWLAYVGLVKRRSSETIQGIAWMAGAATAALLFLNNPLTVPVFLNNAVNQIQATLLNVITSSTSAVGGGENICSLPLVDGSAEGLTPEQQAEIAEANRMRNIRTSQCVQWQVFLFAPWSAGQFGSLSSHTVPDAVPVSINGFEPQSPEVIAGTGATSGPSPARSMALVHLDAYTMNHNQVIAGGLTDAERQLKVAQRQAIYNEMVNLSRGGDTGVTSPDVAAIQTWTGADPGTRISTAILALLSILLGAAPIFALTFLLLLYQLGTLFLLLLAPVFLTVGINPGWGRRLALGWVEQLLNLSIKRIGTTVLIAILLAVIQAIVLSGGAWIAQVFLIAATGIGILVFRGRILDMLASVNLGGTNSLDIEEATRKGAGRVSGVAAGAVTGAGMALAGGAGIAGAGKAAGAGAMAGGSSGRAWVGTQAGYGTATAAIRRSNQKREERKQEESQQDERRRREAANLEYENLIGEIAKSAEFTTDDIKGIRETRRNMGSEAALEKITSMRESARLRRRDDQELHAHRLQTDPLYRNQVLRNEQMALAARQQEEMQREISLMREEDDAMRNSSPAQADMWISRWQGEAPGGEGKGRSVPVPESEELRRILSAAGVPMRDWVKDDGAIPPTQSTLPDEETQRQFAERALRRATGNGGDSGGRASRPPQA